MTAQPVVNRAITACMKDSQRDCCSDILDPRFRSPEGAHQSIKIRIGRCKAMKTGINRRNGGGRFHGFEYAMGRVFHEEEVIW